MNAMEILVIILSVFLTVFLVVGIVLLLLLVKVTLQIRRVTAKAERAAGGFETIAKKVSSATSGAMIGRTVLKVLRALYSKKKGKRK